MIQRRTYRDIGACVAIHLLYWQCIAMYTIGMPVAVSSEPDEHRDHVALYGNVRILRSWCKECDGWAFVFRGELACCGESHKPEPSHYRRLTSPPLQRRQLTVEEQDGILSQQNYSCFYCDRRFGSHFRIRSKERVLLVRWDHQVPFCLTQDSRPENIVAACQMCNSWKASKVFKDVEEARVYLYAKWAKHKTFKASKLSIVPEMYGVVRT